MREAESYVIETSPDPATAMNWKDSGTVSNAYTVVNSLTCGTRAWIRVSAVGAVGSGPWGGPAMWMVR